MSIVSPGVYSPMAAGCQMYVDKPGAYTTPASRWKTSEHDKPGASSTIAAGWQMYGDRPGACQLTSIAVLALTRTGPGSHKSLRSLGKRPDPLRQTVHLIRLPKSAKAARCGAMKSDPRVLDACRSMEETYDALAQRLLEISRMTGPQQKYMVGLAGPPGSGKSTVAGEVVTRLNRLWREETAQPNETTDISVAVPMDGFHLYRWQLDAMADPTEAHARRGAPWTFDPVRLVDRLHTLRQKGSVVLPSFDHGVGDPVEDDIYVEDGHRVVVVEGNYLLLRDGPWNALGDIFDERWYVEVDLDEAMSRIERRHVLTGKPPEIAKWNVAYNDRRNAELIHQSRWNADLLIQSTPLNIPYPLL